MRSVSKHGFTVPLRRDASAKWEWIWWVGIVLLLTLLLVIFWCPALGAQTREALPAGWKMQEDGGSSVGVPPSWSARKNADAGWTAVGGPDGAMVVIWPVFLDATGLQPTGASAVAMQLTAAIWPDVQWRGAMPVGRNAVKLAGMRGETLVVAAFTWVSSPRGTAGRLYAAAANGARYAGEEDTFARIMGSFQLKGTGTATPERGRGAVLRYVQWADPRESAFAVEVPEGWRVQGGMFRRAANDTVAAVVADSPDGKVEVQMGDPSIPTFMEPTQMGMSMGFGEGQWYEPMPGSRFLLRRYLPAPYFLNEYVRTRMGSACQQFQMEQPRNRPESVQSINMLSAQMLAATGTVPQCTGGDVAFTCQRNGQEYKGYFFAMTRLTRMMGAEGGNWDLYQLVGYMATTDRAEEGREVAAHLIHSMQYNPRWAAMQEGITANAAQIVSQTNAEISNMINTGYERRSAMEDDTARMRTNAIQGRLDVVDTTTGEALKVSTGSNYYWMDYRGNIVGTETASAPNADFHELMKRP